MTKFVASNRTRDTQTTERMVAPYTPLELESLVARYGSPLMIIDCDIIRAQYRALQAALPGVDLHYALKPFPELAVVKTLNDLGCFFDLASSGEVELVRRAGVAPERCIHTHPIKTDSDIRDAMRFGVRTFVADNVAELGKFVRHRKRCDILLRISFRAEDTPVDLSKKFGCEPQAALTLLDTAKRLGLRVVGFSFHVGSQTATPGTYVRAIETCIDLIDRARAAGHLGLALLDIGGGFPVSYREPMMDIESFCVPIRAALSAMPKGIRVIAEPGRFIAAPSGTCVSSVVGRAERGGRWWFYLDDGVYGSFSGQIYDHAIYPIDCLKTDSVRVPAVLAGPTCDSIDVIDETIELPLLEAGDLVVGRVMGAYNSASATDFNFIPRARVLAINVTADAVTAS